MKNFKIDVIEIADLYIDAKKRCTHPNFPIEARHKEYTNFFKSLVLHLEALNFKQHGSIRGHGFVKYIIVRDDLIMAATRETYLMNKHIEKIGLDVFQLKPTILVEMPYEDWAYLKQIQNKPCFKETSLGKWLIK